jgi:multiple sugar transport system ATP-binding protein
MTLGIRPEHITDQRPHSGGGFEDFEAGVEVVEPMGIDTMVFFSINGTELCARARPRAVGPIGKSMPFTVDMNEMHLIDPANDRVV